MLPKRRKPRKKQRHRLSVRLELFAKKLHEMPRFDAHHRQIDAKKQCRKQEAQPPTPRRDREPKTKQKATEVERITRERIRTGRGELCIFSDVSRGPCAQR